MTVHRPALLTLALLVAPACGKKHDSGPAAEERASMTPAMVVDGLKGLGTHKDKPPTGAPRAQPKLTVTVDGKAVVMATALAYRAWDGTIRLTASSVAVGCDEVTGEMRRFHDGEVTFDVSAASALQPDGGRKGEVRSTYFEGSTMQRTVAATLVGDGSPGQPTQVDVDFEATSAGRDAHKLVVKGTIDALGCAVPPRANAPALPPPMAATIELAGVTLPIRGAQFSTLGSFRSLDLYTGAEGCKQVAFQTPSDLHVRLTWFHDGDPKVGQIDLDGTLVAPRADQTYDKTKVTVTPTPTAAGEFALAADVKVSGFPLKLSGKVTAVDCKAAK